MCTAFQWNCLAAINLGNVFASKIFEVRVETCIFSIDLFFTRLSAVEGVTVMSLTQNCMYFWIPY